MTSYVTVENDWLRVECFVRNGTSTHEFGTEKLPDYLEPRTVYIYCTEIDEFVAVIDPLPYKLFNEADKLLASWK